MMDMCRTNRTVHLQRRALLVVVVGVAAVLAFAAATGAGAASDSLGHDFAPDDGDEEPEFVVSMDGPETAAPGSTVTVNVTVTPTDELGDGSDRTKKIDWFELPVTAERLDFEGVEPAEFGSVEVERDNGSLFLDSDEELRAADAPLTLATLEFTVTGEDDGAAAVGFGEHPLIGWGPDWLRPIPIFHHQASFQGTTVAIESPDEDIGGFEATNTGGYIGTDWGENSGPPEEPARFPQGSVTIEAAVDNGTWESTTVEFPTIEDNGTEIEGEISFPDGLSGELDREGDFLTASGTLQVTLDAANETARYDIDATTGVSGFLEGDASLGEDGGTATLVDNEFVIDGPCVIEIPPCFSGANYFELPLEIEFVDEPRVEPHSFDAVSTGGFISIDEGSESTAREEGIEFGPGDVQIEGAIENESWDSTSVEFAQQQTAGLTVDVDAPDGLSGEFDSSTSSLTAAGELAVEVSGANFSFDIAATTGESGTLDGDANLDAEGGTATLVDNEYIITDETLDPLLDPVIGLPSTEPGRNWLEIPLDIQTNGGPDGGLVQIVALDQSGYPVEGATVSADGRTTTTDADGRATIRVGPATPAVTVEAYDTTRTIEDPEPSNGTYAVRFPVISDPATFDATGSGGFVAFDEPTEADARENGLAFDDGSVRLLDAHFSSAGEWESTAVEFEPLEIAGLTVNVDAPEGLDGELRPASDYFSVEGPLHVEISNETFGFTVSATTEGSGALDGAADLDRDGGRVTVVDNEFVVDDQSGNVILDTYFGLPSTEPGTNWFELQLDITVRPTAVP